jgi:hypothetical protein
MSGRARTVPRPGVPGHPQSLREALAPPTAPPPRAAFTPGERRLVDRLRTPLAVQRWLNALPYNTEPGGETLRTFRGVVARGTAHCLEAALFAAVVLEQHGHPPLLLSFESQDRLDHVIFIYRGDGGWGSVARSRDPGLTRACTAGERASPRRGRWRSATSTPMSTTPAACAATPSSTSMRRCAATTGVSRPATCGRSSRR